MDMITLNITTESSIPLYLQLYTFLKIEIQEGRIPCDTKLPSKRKLSSYLKISQNTIQTAYDQLMEEGYIIPIERKGFFVCKLDLIASLKTEEITKSLDHGTHNPSIAYDFSYHGIDMETFPFSTWRKLTKDVLNEFDKELLKLGNSQGYGPLRSVIASYLHQSRGVPCTEQQIIISSGTELLFQILFQLFEEDCMYGIENPGYEKLNLLFTSNRARFKAINIDKNGMIPDEVINSGANILCITPAHQFPSGEIMPINRRIQLLNWANEASGRYLVEDDYDSEFKYSGKPIPALCGLDSNEKVIYMGSFSKALSPTLRISYMVLPHHLLVKYISKLSYLICPVPIIEQKVLYQFIQEGFFERHLNKMRTIYRKKRELLVNQIQQLHQNIIISGADAGLHLLLKVNNGMTEEQLVTSAFLKGVKVYGISKYYYNQENPIHFCSVLIGFAALSEDDITKAIKKLSEAWFSFSLNS
ncbi:MAG: transcriptional regulator, GntR family with aminotransferase domain [Herbinix sp.]|nr:transcriptional regulator, GntR family with aminotransferase domain [Herbinix sp.]